MTEPSKDAARDKAVEEALDVLAPRQYATPADKRAACELIWQRAQEAEREECAKVAERVPLSAGSIAAQTQEAIAQAIRNRSAARASEEPKPCPQCGAERCLGGAH